MLDPRERRLIRLFAATVIGQWDVVRQIRAEAEPPEPDRTWREAILMVHLFAGFPRQISTYDVLASAGGLGTAEPDEFEGIVDDPERGRALFDVIYAAQSERVQERLRVGHPDVVRWILGHAYGRVLARPGLSTRVRELLAVSALLVLRQERQLASHVRGAIYCGATAAEVLEVLEVVDEFLPDAARPKLDAVIRQFSA